MPKTKINSQYSNDFYAKEARKNNYRSRAVYKLLEIDQKYHLINKNSMVLELGSTPGSWSQVASLKVEKGNLIAVDLLDMKKVENCYFIQGDFMNSDIQTEISGYLEKNSKNKFNLVLSDMAPNITGINEIDQANFEQINDEFINLVINSNLIQTKAKILLKIFNGIYYNSILEKWKKVANKIIIVKPKASKSNSKEIYWLIQGLK